MEVQVCEADVRRNCQKRKFLATMDESEEHPTLCLGDVHEDLLERVLAWLPTSTFFRASSVCKRWKSLANSSTFKIACSQVPSRNPWYFMVDAQFNLSKQQQFTFFDSDEKNWKRLNHNLPVQSSSCDDFLLVASSGGLLCFKNASGEFTISNPVNGKFRQITALDTNEETEDLLAIAMAPVAIDSSYKLVLVSKEFQELSLRVYSSRTQLWEEEVHLKKNKHTPFGASKDDDGDGDDDEESSEYFLSKWGNVVSPSLQRSPCKRYSSVIVEKGGEEIMYFLNSTGKIIRCNLTNACYDEYPRLLPINYEYSIDLVQCGGDMMVILLSEFLESASLKVWSLDEKSLSWQQLAVMPPSMSQEFYSKKVDINCTASAGGDQIFVCLSSHGEVYRYYLCNLSDNNWVELLPNPCGDKSDREFVCAFAFEPRIEAEKPVKLKLHTIQAILNEAKGIQLIQLPTVPIKQTAMFTQAHQVQAPCRRLSYHLFKIIQCAPLDKAS